MKYCTDCGTPLKDEAKFCSNCGTPQEAVGSAPPPPPPREPVQEERQKPAREEKVTHFKKDYAEPIKRPSSRPERRQRPTPQPEMDSTPGVSDEGAPGVSGESTYTSQEYHPYWEKSDSSSTRQRKEYVESDAPINVDIADGLNKLFDTFQLWCNKFLNSGFLQKLIYILFLVESPTEMDEEQVALREDEIRAALPFISSRERIRATIGNGYIKTILMDGVVKRTVAVLTDGRLYYKGSLLRGSGTRTSHHIEEGSVRVEDITYTGLKHGKPFGLKVVYYIFLAISIFFLFTITTCLAELGLSGIGDILDPVSLAVYLFPMVVTAFLRYRYAKGLSSEFVVKFSGGGLAFDMHYYPQAESEQFMTALQDAVDEKRN